MRRPGIEPVRPELVLVIQIKAQHEGLVLCDDFVKCNSILITHAIYRDIFIGDDLAVFFKRAF